MGVKNAGFDVSLLIEKDIHACRTVKRNAAYLTSRNKKLNLWHGDAREFEYNSVEDEIALVCGGPSCQPFSIGGRHAAQADDRDMFPEAIRAVRELFPHAFIFENVKGLTRPRFQSYLNYLELQMTYPELQSKIGEDWHQHLARLQRFHTQGSDKGLTYRVISQVVNAANFGIPQKRERVFFVGFRKDIGIEWFFPRQTHSFDSLLLDQLEGGYWERHEIPKAQRWPDKRLKMKAERLLGITFGQPWRTVRDAISDLPEPDENAFDGEFNSHVLRKGARSYKGHTGSFIDLPAKTLKAGKHGVPGGENMLLNSDGSVRYFTVRECARLQTFPDSFNFEGVWSANMRQLGNAVPVLLAEIIAKSVFSELSAKMNQIQ